MSDALVQIGGPVSKSLARAMGCEYFYVHHYRHPERRALEPASELSRVGNEFHEYRAAYVTHLVKADHFHDTKWVEEWITTHVLMDRTVERIRADAAAWAVNPRTVYGSELFLSIDRNFEHLEEIEGRQPGSVSSHPQAHASGQIDLLLLDGDQATIVDAKSGFSVQNITEEEAAIYCCLVFARFPQVEYIEFKWDFVQVRLQKTSQYSREDLPALRELVDSLVRKRADIEQRALDGPVSTYAWAGNCPYCPLDCPTRKQADQDILSVLTPLQTEADAQQLARIVYVCEQFSKKARPLLKAFLAARGADYKDGQMPVAEDFVMEDKTATERGYGVYEALSALGLGVVDLSACTDAEKAEIIEQQPKTSPSYDVPMSKLRIGATALNSYAKAQKRNGLRAELDKVAEISPGATTLRFRKVSLQLAAGEEGDIEG